MSLRSITVIGAIIALNAFSQEQKATVVKSEAMEMKAVDERPAGVIILKPAAATGDFDLPPAHPECAPQKNQESLDCTSTRIKKLIREKMGAPALDMEQWGSSVVGIDFNINQFGEVKDIRVDHSGDRELSKQVIIALYDLPKFTAATKGGTSVPSAMRVNYRYEDLFKQ